MTFEAWLAANHYDAAALPETQRKHLEAAWKAEYPPAPVVKEKEKEKEASADGGFDAQIEACRRENARIMEIRDATAAACRANVLHKDKIDTFNSICQQAISENWTLERFQLAMLREERSVGPMVLTPRKQQVTGPVVEAAICAASGMKEMEKVFDAQTLQESHTQFRAGIGLQELIGMCASANGWHGRSVKSDLHNALRHAFRSQGWDGAMLAVGPSTLDITGILSSTANKFLRVGFNAVESAWREVTAIRSVNDFKTITSYTLTGDLTYDKVAPGGEIKSGTLGETSYTNRADTYGKLLGLDRRDIINDDLGALSTAGTRLGRGAALKLNDVFWTCFLDDSSFFNTDKSKNNYDDGSTDSVLSLAGLENADLIFRQQTDPDGKPLGIMPMILLVPVTLRVTAANLMNSTMVVGQGQSAAVVPANNPWASLFRVVSTVYLSNSSFTGYSTTAWYLLASPADLPVVETCFLNGAEMPTVETAEVDFNRLGIALRGYHDFGVTKQEYRAGVKLKGAA